MGRLSKIIWLCLLVTLLGHERNAAAGQSTQAGSYRVEVSTDPPVVPIGKAKLRLKILNAEGKPVTGISVRTLTRMPGMSMGEREETAKARPDVAGEYEAPASFPMGGGYVVDLRLGGADGEVKASLPLQTGQNTSDDSSSSSAFRRWLLPTALILGLTFTLWRMRRTGQHPNWRSALHWQTVAGIGVLLGMSVVGRYAVNHWRRPGSMTPLEAQGMEMSMPAPEGTTAVELATVKFGQLRSTVLYTGQAVGYIEQDVFPRVTGNLIWMPFYAGDRVRRGQLLARLDRSQIEPQIAGQRAARTAAVQGARVAEDEYGAALANVRQQEAHWRVRIAALSDARQQERKMRAQIGARLAEVSEVRAQERKARAGATNRRGAVVEAAGSERRARATLKEAATQSRGAGSALSEAQSDIAVAREEQSNAESDLVAAQSSVPDSEAEVAAAAADVEAETQEMTRLRALISEGIVSRRDVERQAARVESARSKLKQAQARVIQAGAGVRGAQSRIRRAQAAVRGAEAKAQQANAAIEGADARREAVLADITAAGARVQQSNAEVEGAGAEIGEASSRVRRAQADVEAARDETASAAARVQQAQAELEEGQGAVRTARAQAAAVRGRIGQAQSGIAQAEANVAQSETTAGYTEIRSLLDGLVTQRLISPGTLVNPGQAILKIAQINPIRLQANVADVDLKRLHVGNEVVVRGRDGKEPAMRARLTAVAPAVDAQSRTGVVEAVIGNPDRRFLPGEYVVLEIATGQSIVPLSVPVTAVQQRPGLVAIEKPTHFVWVAEGDRAGTYTVHPVPVQTGVSNGEQIEIRSGLKAGQRVVTLGYQNLTDGASVTTATVTPVGRGAVVTAMPTPIPGPGHKAAPPLTTGATPGQMVGIAVTEKGFEPGSVSLNVGVPTKLTFTRKTDATCATEVVFPEFDIRKPLPLNKPVTIEITPTKTGTLTYACGMDMIRGQVVVR